MFSQILPIIMKSKLLKFNYFICIDDWNYLTSWELHVIYLFL